MNRELANPVADARSVVHGLYATLGGESHEPLERWISPQIVLEVPGDSPNAGRYEGMSAFQTFLTNAHARSAGSLRLSLHDVAVGEQHVVALATYTAQRPGRAPLENRLCHLMRIERGQVVYSRFYTGDQYAVDAFWRD